MGLHPGPTGHQWTPQAHVGIPRLVPRTAPVPNIPAIPGMNPGVFVMGGGGGGGGGSGKGGNGAGGQQGANGENGGEGADGACGGANGSGCGHPSHNPSSVAAGDPIDVATGAVFTPASTDVRLPGALPFVFQRFYRSDQVTTDIGFGPGWSHSLAWRLVAGRRYVRVHRPDGSVIEVSKLEPGQMTIGGQGVGVLARSYGYVVDAGGLRVVLKKVKGADAHLATAIIDGFGNATTLRYSDGLLVGAQDSAGRQVRFRRVRGRIAGVDVKTATHRGHWQTFAEYRYDRAGRLQEVVDAIGAVTAFSYDDEHRLLSRTTPNGFRFRYTYDDAGRGIQTWGEHDDPVRLGLDADVPDVLTDGHPAKGAFHCRLVYDEGFAELSTSRTIHRYEIGSSGGVTRAANGAAVHVRALDDKAMLVDYTDPAGGVSRFERDAWGRVVSVRAPDGATTLFERTPDGALSRVVYPDGTTKSVSYGPNMVSWIDAIGAMFQVETDPRGLITCVTAPNGLKTSYRHDEHGNEIEAEGRYGQLTRREFDGFGRCISITDASGATARFAYNRRGDLVRRTSPTGENEHFHYDGEGNLVERVDAAGRVTRFTYGPAGRVVAMVKGDGRSVALRYDREGLLVRIVNAKGESHTIERDMRGLPVVERTFDGRRYQYGYDDSGRRAWQLNGEGDRADYSYDEAGRISSIEYSDEVVEQFEYDVMGRLVAADNGEVGVTLVRNDAGWVVTERQSHADETHEVWLRHDTMGHVVEMGTTGGLSAAFERDAYGLVRAVELDRDLRVTTERDQLGRERARVLPSGARIESSYDAAGRLLRRALQGPERIASRGEPSRVGARAVGAHQAYQYGPGGDVLSANDSASGTTRFEYDPAGRVMSVIPEHARGRLFAYDADDNHYEQDGGERVYGEGGRLLSDGAFEYVYDAAGRLRERRGVEGVVTYEWTAKGTLAEVREPSGLVHRYVYDAFGRRVAAASIELNGAPGGERRRRSRYVWSDEHLVHELEERRRPDRSVGASERSYLMDDVGVPWAQQLRMNGMSRWTFSVRDHRDAQVREVSVDGDVVKQSPTDVWGQREMDRATVSRFGLPGQHIDAETGLAYNRHRYYDLATGRYLSPDPIGLAGGLQPYGYGRANPLRYVDPLGLMPKTVIRDRAGNVIAEGESASNLPSGSTLTHQPVTQGSIDSATQFVDHEGNVQSDTSRSSGPCAEAAALSDLERRVRNDNPDASDDAVQAEMRRRVDGGTITTTDDSGNLMAPCPACARMLDDSLGQELAQRTVRMPDARGNPVPWDGQTTQSGQGSGTAPRPDDRRETARMRHEGDDYQSPADRAADAEAERRRRQRATYHRRQDLSEAEYQELRDAGFSRDEIQSSHASQADQEYDEGRLDDDGNLID